MERLTATVHVVDEDGGVHTFGPSDEVPTWAAEMITNPLAWEGAPAPVAPEPEPEPVPTAPVPAPEPDPEPVPAPASPEPVPPAPDGPAGEVAQAPPPPRSGPKASRAAWARYAESRGMKVSAADERNEIIVHLEDAGLIERVEG